MDRAAELNPADPDLQWLRGPLLEHAGRAEEAIRGYAAAVDFAPGNDYEDWLLKATLLRRLARWQEAFERTARAEGLKIVLDPREEGQP